MFAVTTVLVRFLWFSSVHQGKHHNSTSISEAILNCKHNMKTCNLGNVIHCAADQYSN